MDAVHIGGMVLQGLLPQMGHDQLDLLPGVGETIVFLSKVMR